MSSISQTTAQHSISKQLNYFIGLQQMQFVVARRFDHMGSMVGFTDFIVLYHLSQAEDQKMRRIDLAEKMGLTASGVTRILLPLEKLLLVSRESNPRDGRVSMAKLTSDGKRVLNEALERAEYIASESIPADVLQDVAKMTDSNEAIRRAAL